MSAKNRKTDSLPNDNYPTPVWCIELFIKQVINQRFGPQLNKWLEPCANSGQIIKTANELIPRIKWSARELVQEHYQSLNQLFEQKQIVDFTIGDFLDDKIVIPERKWDLIFTNPPYVLAEDFLFKSLKVSRFVIFLLSLNFLGSQGRTWLDKNMPDVYILPKRPQFRTGINPKTGKKYGTDAVEYGWFLWDSDNPKSFSRVERLKMVK